MSPTLRDVLARGTPIEWFEAVAIVQTLCKRLLDHPSPGAVRVPDLHEVVLVEDGTVEVTGEGPTSQSPVFRVGEIFLALAGGRSLPVSLRLLALTIVSPSPSYATLGELTAAFDYYERPNRAELVRGVYERYTQLPSALEPTMPLGEIPAAPPPPITEPRPGPPWWRKRRVVLAATAVVLVAVVGGAAWAVTRWQPQWVAGKSGAVSVAVRAATEVVATTVSAGIEKVREQFGGGAPTVAVEPPPEPSRAPEPARQPARLRASGGWLTSGPAGAVIATPVATAGNPPDVPGLAPLGETAAVMAPAVQTEDWTVYSANDADVVPPVSAYPRLPSAPESGPSENAAVLELIVAASGDVERLRLLTPTREVRTNMLLSAAKAWRFVPAMRNGVPVRYSLSVRLPGQ
jgi:hypothetical protein